MWAEEAKRAADSGTTGEMGRRRRSIEPDTAAWNIRQLLDIDKVDLVVSPYATNQKAAAMPVIMRRGIRPPLLATAANDEFKYDRYFQLNPNGPDAKDANSAGFLRRRRRRCLPSMQAELIEF